MMKMMLLVVVLLLSFCGHVHAADLDAGASCQGSNSPCSSGEYCVDRSAVGNCVPVPANSYAVYDGADGTGTAGVPAPTGDALLACLSPRTSVAGSALISDCKCPVDTYAATGANDNTGACTACVSAGVPRTSAAGSILAASCVCPADFYGTPDNAATCVACDGGRTSVAGSTAITDCENTAEPPSPIIMAGQDCVNVHMASDGSVACEPGTYCKSIPYAPPICTAVCDTCYVSEPIFTPHFSPGWEFRCDDGYASYMAGWVTGMSVEMHTCNICEKGWYSDVATQDGMGSYVQGTSTYPGNQGNSTYPGNQGNSTYPGNQGTSTYPGNQGCTKCPYGYTTSQRGSGFSIDDCTFLGQLPEVDWKPEIVGASDIDVLKLLAISRIEASQGKLLDAAKATRDLETANKVNLNGKNQCDAIAVISSAQISMLRQAETKVSESFDGVTGTMTCLVDDDCNDIEQTVYAKQMQSGNFEHNLACIKETEGSAVRGACKASPLLKGSPIPDCAMSCVKTCVENEATRLSVTLDEFMNMKNTIGPELCTCIVACDLATCTSESDKAKISHMYRDTCHVKDPYYVAPVGTGGTGGNNLKCGFGQYVKYKNVPNMEVCTDCPPGRFAKAKTSRNKECKRCPRGWIQPAPKQGRCTRCESGKKANSARTACI